MKMTATIFILLATLSNIFSLNAVSISTSSLSVSLSINEEAAPETIIGLLTNQKNIQQLSSTSKQRLTFSLAKANAYFSVDENSGMVRSRVRIDREALCNEFESCCSSVSAGQTDCVIPLQVLINPIKEFLQVAVTVVDVNDHAPTFAQSPMTTFVPENEVPGRYCIDIPQAFDPDSTQLSVRDYRLDPFSSTFKLRVTGRPATRYSDLCLLVMESLDREKVQSYSLRILAIDGGSPPRTGTLSLAVRVVDTNDNRPIFVNSSYSVTVPEHTQVNTEITRVHATDADEGENGYVMYSFISTVGEIARESATFQPLSTDRVGPFSINAETGQIVLESPLDYEETRMYELRVMARDSASQTQRFSTQSLLVRVTNVNDCAPEVEILPIKLRNLDGDAASHLQVYENEQAGTTIGMVSVTDRDERSPQALRCTLSSSHFNLVPLKGEPNKLKIVTRYAFDREEVSRFEVNLRCDDNGEPSLVSETSFTVIVIDRDDNQPHFTSNETVIHVPENNAIGQLLGSLSVLDLDEELSNVLFEISSLDSDLVDNVPQVTVKSETGEVFASAVFDRETRDSYRFAIRILNEHRNVTIGSSLLLLLIDDVNDEPPRFEKSIHEFKVYENLEPRVLIGSVRASDRDKESQIRYSLAQPHASFSINDDGDLFLMSTLDRESTAEYSLQVIAHDPKVPEMTAIAQVRIAVLDRNDNKPVFIWPNTVNHTLNVSVYSQPGVIARLAANDIDAGENAHVKFLVQKRADTENLFEVDEETGQLSLKQALRPEDRRFYKLVIEAIDAGQPTQRELTVLNVLFTDTPLPQYVVTTGTEAASKEDSSRMAVIGSAILFTVALSLTVVSLVIMFMRRSRAERVRAKRCSVHERGSTRSSSPDFDATRSCDTTSESARSSLSFPYACNGSPRSSLFERDDACSSDCHTQLTIDDMRPVPAAAASRNFKFVTNESHQRCFKGSSESISTKRSLSSDCIIRTDFDEENDERDCLRTHISDFAPVATIRGDTDDKVSDKSARLDAEFAGYRVYDNPMGRVDTPQSDYRMFTNYGRAQDGSMN